MIKEQPMIKQEPHFEGVFYCLNPFCGDQLNRKFRNDDRHFLRVQCKKWIIDQDALCAQYEPLQAKTINNLHIDFQEQPLKAFELLLRLRESDWRKVLEAEQAKTKKEILRAIQVEFEAVREKMQNLLENASLFSKACHIAQDHEDPSALLNEFYEHNLPEIDALNSRVLFKRMQLREAVVRVKEQVQSIFESIIEQQNTETSGTSSHQQQRQFHQFVFEQSTQYFNKLQKLATALKKSVPDFRVEGQAMLLECCLCQRLARTTSAATVNGKKAVKKYLAEQILTHIYCSHYGEAAFAYTHRIAKLLVFPLTFQQFLTQSRKSKRITIVDRESGVTYEEQYSAQGGSGFTVEVISVKNAGMARGRHILVQNHLSTDCLVAILSYVCTQRDQNVEIVTNRPALKIGIEDLLWCQIKEEEQLSKKE